MPSHPSAMATGKSTVVPHGSDLRSRVGLSQLRLVAERHLKVHVLSPAKASGMLATSLSEATAASVAMSGWHSIRCACSCLALHSPTIALPHDQPCTSAPISANWHPGASLADRRTTWPHERDARCNSRPTTSRDCAHEKAHASCDATRSCSSRSLPCARNTAFVATTPFARPAGASTSALLHAASTAARSASVSASLPCASWLVRCMAPCPSRATPPVGCPLAPRHTNAY
mmetsp:Transcript_3910/g.12429  ORF Transcript_3910/g.12429 Transcript_3910/m.12429 type:complete len:231 (+) Transcript_3910:2276-2968(+)